MDKYLIVRRIGEGSYGTVHLAMLKSDYPHEKRALKIFKNGGRADSDDDSLTLSRNSSSDRRHLRLAPEAEANILRMVHHPHIIKMYEFFSTPQDDVLVLEYAPHGDLLNFMNARRERGFSERIARGFFLQILSAVRYLHDFGYIHCDVKLENILLFESLTNPVLKLTDFGFAIPYSPSKKMQYGRGSLHYASPEIILSREFYGPEADIWSLGVVLFTLVCGAFPLDFSNRSVGDAYKLLDRQGPPFGLAPRGSQGISSEYRTLVRRMLTLKADLRITMSDIFDSEWISGSSGGSHRETPEHELGQGESSITSPRSIDTRSERRRGPPVPPSTISPRSRKDTPTREQSPPVKETTDSPGKEKEKENRSILRSALKVFSPRNRRANSHPDLRSSMIPSQSKDNEDKEK